MSYVGSQIPIPIGQLGLRTDDPTTSLPANAAIKANNISLYSGRVEKMQGTTKYNTVQLSASVVGVYDWWPTPALQRTFAVTSDGNVFRDVGDSTFNGGVPITTGLGSPLTPSVQFVTGGTEQAGNARKLFLLTGRHQLAYYNGDSTTLTTTTKPSPDWASANFPTNGVIYQNRLAVAGCATNPHQIYFSTLADHSDYTTGSPTGTPTISVFPGDGDGITQMFVYLGLLFVFKQPFGVYIVDGRNPDETQWTVQKYSGDVGPASNHAIVSVLGDMIVANTFGSYTSFQASNAFGDFQAGDVLANNQVEVYLRSIFDESGINVMQSIYYPEKKLAMFTGRTGSATPQNLILSLDVARQSVRPTVITKDQPTSLALRRDFQNILRPFYGDALGNIWFMEQPTNNVNGAAFVGEFQTAYTDLSFAQSELAGKNKIFDFLEINYIPTNNGSIYVDVYIDGNFRQTLTFIQKAGAVLDAFVLDTDTLAGDPAGSSNRLPLLSCTGKRISFRVYNGNANESFKVERLIVGFRVSAEQINADQV